MNCNNPLSISPSNISILNIYETLRTPSFQNLSRDNDYSSSPFIAQGSIQEALLHLLYSTNTIDKYGILSADLLEPLPYLNTTQREVFEEHLNAKYLSTTRKEFFQSIQTHGNKILDIEGVGGIAKKTLLSSKSFILDVLSILTKAPKEILSQYVTEEFLSEKERVLPDIDIRTTIPKAKKKDLYTCTSIALQKILDLTGMSEEEFRNCPSKFNVIFDEHNQFSIISYESLELLYVIKLYRQYLFTLDAIKISFFQYLQNPSAELEFKSDIGNGGQTLIDLITRVIHIKEPETADHLTFPMLISYLVRGYVFGDPEQNLRIILNKAKEIKKNHPDVPSHIAALLSSAYKAHHSQDTQTILAMTGTAWMLLKNELSPQELGKLWELLEKQFWTEQTEVLTHSFLGKIALLMLSPKISLLTPEEKSNHLLSFFAAQAFGIWFHLSSGQKSASVHIRNHVGSPALQLPCENSIFLVPMNFSEAIDKLISALSKDLQSEILEIIEQTAFLHYREDTCTSFSLESLTQCGLNPDDLEEKAQILFKIRNRAAQFIGYLCLLASQMIKPNPQSVPELLEKFIPSIGVKSIETRTFVIQNLITIAKQTGDEFLIEILQNFKDSTDKITSEKELLLSWLTHLATCHENKIIHLVYNLWIQYREKYPYDLRQQNDLSFIASLSSKALPEALTLFLLYQQTALSASKEELSALHSLLEIANTASNPLFMICMPRLHSSLTHLFSYGRPYTYNITIPPQFIEALTETLRHFLIAKQFLQARCLWELAVHHPFLSMYQEQLKKGWLLLTEAAIEHHHDIHETTYLWKKGQKFPKNDFYKSLFFSLTRELLKYAKDKQGIKNLVTLMKENPKEPKIADLVFEHLERLISIPQIHLSAQMILQFNPLFSDSQKLTYYPLIIQKLMHRNEWKIAATIWFLLPPKGQSAKLTKSILTELMKLDSSPFILSLTLKILHSKKASNLLPNIKQAFLKQISSTIAVNPHQKNIISFFHVALREFPFIAAKDQLEILLPVLKALSQMDSIKLRTFKRMFSVLPYVIELLKKSNDLLTVAQLISLIELEEIPSKLFPQLFDLHKDIVKHLINTNNIPLGLLWIAKGKKWVEGSARDSWVQELTLFLISSKTHAFPEFVLREEELLLQIFSYDDLTYNVDAWLSNCCESITQEILDLLIKYPPCHASCWEKLFLIAMPSQLSTLWNVFNVWRLKSNVFTPDLEICWLTVLKVIHKMESPPFKELLKEQITTSDSTLFSSLESCQLILSGFLQLEAEENEYNDFMILYKNLPTSNLTIMLDLLEQAAEKSPSNIKLCVRMVGHLSEVLFKNSSQWDLRILSIIRTLIDKGPGTDKEAFISLFKVTIVVQSFLISIENIFTDQPLDALSALKKNLIEIDLTKLALSASKYDYSEALECCHLILVLLYDFYGAPTSLASRIWANYLIHRVKEQNANINTIETKIALLLDHCTMWKVEESAFHECTELLINLIVESLFKDQLISQFANPLHYFLHEITGLEINQESSYLQFSKYFLLDLNSKSVKYPIIIEGFPVNCNLTDLNAKKELYYQVMHLSLMKIMETASHKAELSEEIYLMVYSYINYLTNQYPQKKHNLSELAKAFVFMRPLHCPFFNKHATLSTSLLETMIELGIHSTDSVSSFKALVYIGKKSPSTGKIPLSDLSIALLELKDIALNCPETIAITFLGYCIREKSYSQIFSLKPNVAIAFHEAIISRLSYTKQMNSSLNCNFFNAIKYSFISYFNNMGNTIAEKNSFVDTMNSLFNKIWDLAIPELSYQDNLQSLLWISNFLIEFRKTALFNAFESINYHLGLVKKVVKESIITLKQLKEGIPTHNIPEEELMDCIQGITKLIAIEHELGYWITDPRRSHKFSLRSWLPKSIKDEICNLMVEWLSSLPLCKEKLAVVVDLAQKLDVFKDYYKKLQKFKQMHHTISKK